MVFGYNFPEGFNYDFEADNAKEFAQRFTEVENAFLNTEIVCAKVTDVDYDGQTLFLDFGAGVKGICRNNWLSNPNSSWVNKHLKGRIVNVEILCYDTDKKMFVCARNRLQKENFKLQEKNYVKGFKTIAKILHHNDKVVVVDIGGGNITVVNIELFKYFDFENEQYANIIIKNRNHRYNNFWFELDSKIVRAQIVATVDEGYLVSLINKPDKHVVIKTDEKFEIGELVTLEKEVVITTTYKVFSI